ncbi:hypothetical protein [Prevotella jejuni]|uniref:hypothetical protein n=1 Tax=Prevotella jejuni TaxID=1177574 RepID=UPI001C5D427E|nr:hypothetical protein [Prevotella jejuni]MBW4772476.1 hypothetical protein [Prevotella jejuni]
MKRILWNGNRKFKARGLDVTVHHNKIKEGKDIEDRFMDKDDPLSLVRVRHLNCAIGFISLGS